MTRIYNERTICTNCGALVDTETPFNRWVRGQHDLDSVQHGIVRYDCDQLIHRYKFVDRGVRIGHEEALMFVEVKTFGATLGPSQRDTLGMFNQVLRNRRRNMHSQPRRQARGHVPPSEVWSIAKDRWVPIRMFGGHLLTLSAACPASSSWMTWDGKRIDAETLKMLIRFELDPDTVRPTDWRGRWRPTTQPLPLFAP